ncbi:PepSY-associated TM helix domain-containing protein [Mucilaginibacter phyllosphaerae]|uniref:Iron-regulated membrane protein n=1 Tax=Mucilaginibacter phyllosphaerae TaxID=1812349 RepID=A0A4Y8AEB2_9SPHI|nr:PepSY-associated TM helix domain-containing protein [Mucilaginibacter phyllosphaerae]MBB3970426.1 putative iron-regulated membrane protein [Mucilaginibacter phyllosphaerae]TEW66926.1 PepSY domain-containing protein [Mucilaginibacter phyllosphaerae]GGH12836.1 sulfite reductase [Mucilaginibacter phyllosphaerae]
MIPDQNKAKKSNGSRFKRINNWLHLWLGLGSGIIVFIVCLTGCIWVFNEEITGLLEPETNIVYQQKPVLTPAALAAIGEREYPKLIPAYANYQQGKVINLFLRKPGKVVRRGGGGVLLKVNPYNGRIIGKQVSKKGQVDFFRFILNGHRALWLPYDIGRLIVDYATLIFVILLITGLIWWYPKKWNKSTRDKSFKIKWGASFKRVNLDLHNVFGFYAMLFLLFIAMTGMVFGLRWFSDGLYWVTTGGETLKEARRLKSDSLQMAGAKDPKLAMDLIWEKVLAENPKSMGFYYNYPDMANPASTIAVIVYPTAGQFYNSRSYTFDQYTLKPMKRTDPYAVPYQKAGFGQKVRKMNYDIHIGAILGLPGKVMAFLASLIGASLPVTGFLVWWGKRNKKPKKRAGAKSAPIVTGNAALRQKKLSVAVTEG